MVFLHFFLKMEQGLAVCSHSPSEYQWHNQSAYMYSIFFCVDQCFIQVVNLIAMPICLNDSLDHGADDPIEAKYFQAVSLYNVSSVFSELCPHQKLPVSPNRCTPSGTKVPINFGGLPVALFAKKLFFDLIKSLVDQSSFC